MSIEEVIINIIGGAYVKTDSKGKFVIVIRKKEIRVGSHLIMKLIELKFFDLNEKQQYRLNKKMFISDGNVDDFEFKFFISEWKKNIDRRRKANFESESRSPRGGVISPSILGRLIVDFDGWYRNREAYLKKVEAILNED